MKKLVFSLGTGCLLLFGLFSCKNSNLDLDETLKFSKLSVEEQKSKIEDNGVDFINAVDGIQETAAFTAMMNFTANTGGASYVAPFKQLTKDIQNHNESRLLVNFDKQLRAASVESDFWGEYEWDASEERFIQTGELTNKAIYKFPATENSTTNNGELTVTYTESSVSIPDEEDNYPSKITCVIKVSGDNVLESEFSGSYYDNGSPKNLKMTLDIDSYSWKAEIKNNEEDASESYEFKKGSKTLMKIEASAKGNLSADVIEKAEYVDDFLSEGAVYFQVMDVAVLGGMKDVEGFVNEMNDVDNDSKTGEQDEVDIINKYMICYGYYVDDNRKFADVEFYLKEYQDEYYAYNYESGEYELYTETYYEMAPRFVLSDGSKVAVEEYIQSGFEDLVELINGYQEEYNQ